MEKEKLKIVVVDDEPIIRIDIKNMLTNAGYQIVGEGSNGFDAIELSKKFYPDVILMDIKMDDMDGLSAARIIAEECPDTAIIMLTAYSKIEYIDKAKETKISSYLLKPINEKLLVPNIELAVVRNKELTEYKNSVDKANEKLATRKIIERAKGLIMSHRHKTEDEAFNYIRDISKKRNISMHNVSEMIIRQYEE
ncbi:MAG: ANTAR domain-containing response regulator [Christensenellales bacterium]